MSAQDPRAPRPNPVPDEAIEAAYERLVHLIAPTWDEVRAALEAARDAEAGQREG